MALYRDLGRFAESGMGFHQALAQLEEDAGSDTMRRALAAVRADLAAGATLREAFGRQDHLFRPLDLAMLEVGESLGTVGPCTRQLVEEIDQSRARRDAVVRRFVQPFLLFVLANYVLTVPILLLRGLPGYLRTISLPTLGLAAAAAIVGVVLPAIADTLGPRVRDRILLGLPVIGSIVRDMATARFARTLAAAIGAGVEIGKSVRLAARAAGNDVVETAILDALPRAQQIGLGKGFEAGGVLSRSEAAELRAGEATGTAVEALRRIASEASARASRAATALGGILSLGLLGLSAIYAVASVFLAVFAAGQAAIGGVLR